MVGASNDPLELEADQVADQVLAYQPQHSFGNIAAPRIQRREAHSSGHTEEAPANVERVLAHSGSALPIPLRQDMEQRFGQDFSQVRMHTGSAAEQSARELNARAYTHGNNIVFGAGQFNPGSPAGKHLLAHELTHVMQQKNLANNAIARAPDPKAPKSNFTPQQQARLEQARLNQKADGTRIVGVLITPDGKEYEFISGGPGRFYAHIEGKAVAKMNELGITKATLLVEKEPCQTCDRSTYPYDPLKPAQGGPQVDLQSSKTGKALAREPSMINTGLHKGSELKVVDPVSTGIYRGLKTPPASGPGANQTPLPSEPEINPAPAKAAQQPVKDSPKATPQAPAAVKAPAATQSPPAAKAPTASKPPIAPSVKAPANKVPGAVIGPPKPVATNSTNASAAKAPAPTTANKNPAAGGERQRFSAPVGAFSRPGNFADEANERAQAKGNGAILVVQGVLAILTYFADKYQRERADAAWAEVYPRIQEEITRTGRGVVVYVEYTQNTGSSVLIFEGIHWSSGGNDSGQPGSIRGAGQTASFSRSYVGPTEAQAAISDETALIFRRDEARKKQKQLQDLAELMAKEGWVGRKLRERAGDSIDPIRAYDAKSHIVSASQSIKDKRYSDAAASLDKADVALDDMWAQIKAYVGEKKMKEISSDD